MSEKPSRWRSKMHERKCPCDDGPAELGFDAEPCPWHDGNPDDDEAA